MGRYEESEAFSDGPDELATLPLLPVLPKAAGGSANPFSSCGTSAPLLPVMSREAVGVGGNLGFGMVVRATAMLSNRDV
jgi:hypothetical protein